MMLELLFKLLRSYWYMLRIKINIIELILIDNRVINMIDMINMIEIKRMIKK